MHLLADPPADARGLCRSQCTIVIGKKKEQVRERKRGVSSGGVYDCWISYGQLIFAFLLKMLIIKGRMIDVSQLR